MKVKAKPKKAITKRFKVTGTGKLKRNRPGKRHILTKKSSDRKRKLRKEAVIDETVSSKYAKLMIGA